MGKSMVRRDASSARELEIVRLRVQGLSFDQIADQVGYYDRSGVKKAWDRVMQQALADQAQNRAALAQEELSRTDWLIQCMAPRVEKGDSRAAQVALNAIERRCKLLGLDAPVRLSVEAETLGAEIMSLVATLTQDNTHGDTDA